jgi:hypothetical protein
VACCNARFAEKMHLHGGRARINGPCGSYLTRYFVYGGRLDFHVMVIWKSGKYNKDFWCRYKFCVRTSLSWLSQIYCDIQHNIRIGGTVSCVICGLICKVSHVERLPQ